MQARGDGLNVSLRNFPPRLHVQKGRNFNAGECIQLVLKSPMTGQWLPFSFICRVMIHELAHVGLQGVCPSSYLL